MENVKLEKKKDSRPIWIYMVFNFVLPAIVVFVFGIVSVAVGELDSVEKLNNIVYIVLSFIMFGIFFGMYFKKIKLDIKSLTKKKIIQVIIFSVVTTILNLGITSIFEYFNVTMNNQNKLSDLMDSYVIWMCILTILAGPFVEEVVFRYAFSSIIKNDVAFVIISSIVFGIMHGLGIATLLYVFLGIMLAIIYLKTDRNLMACTIVHIINNLVAVVTMLIFN